MLLFSIFTIYKRLAYGIKLVELITAGLIMQQDSNADSFYGMFLQYYIITSGLIMQQDSNTDRSYGMFLQYYLAAFEILAFHHEHLFIYFNPLPTKHNF